MGFGGPGTGTPGGGAGGATSYPALTAKPQINNVTLNGGNNTLDALGIPSKTDLDALKNNSYEFTQATPAAVWMIQHNLDSQPVNALLVDDAGEQIIGQIDTQTSTNNLLVIRFSEPLAGKAFIKI